MANDALIPNKFKDVTEARGCNACFMPIDGQKVPRNTCAVEKLKEGLPNAKILL